MRVGVIGAGAVGGAIAALLDRAGHSVEVTARGEHLAAIRESGIRLTGGWGEHTARVDADEALTHGPELVIVATKAQDAAAAISQNARLLRGIPLLIVQNGLDGVAVAATAAPRSDVVGGLAMFASSFLAPGEIEVTAAGRMYVGGGSAEHDVPARYVAAVIGDAMPVAIVHNFVGAQWTKLVINQVNALPAITGRSAQEVIRDRGLRKVMTLSMRENVRIGRASGIRFEKLAGLTHRRLALFGFSPWWLGQLLPLAMGARMGARPNPASTLQSIRRGQATEIDYLNGAVVRAAETIGRDAPINRRLVELVHEVEGSRRFLDAGTVTARLATVSVDPHRSVEV